MKSKKLAVVSEELDNQFNQGVKMVEDVINAEEIVAPKDKQGGKLSEKESVALDFAYKNIDKIENKLPRDFDEKSVQNDLTILNAWVFKANELERLKQICLNQATSYRVKLKPAFNVVYDAAEKVAKDNASLAYIFNKMAESHYREAAKPAENKAEKAAH